MPEHKPECDTNYRSAGTRLKLEDVGMWHIISETWRKYFRGAGGSAPSLFNHCLSQHSYVSDALKLNFKNTARERGRELPKRPLCSRDLVPVTQAGPSPKLLANRAAFQGHSQHRLPKLAIGILDSGRPPTFLSLGSSNPIVPKGLLLGKAL